MPARHHLDRRTDELARAVAAEPEDLLFSTRELAQMLGVSEQWVEIGRCRGYGPRFVILGPRRIRYRRGDVLAWLDERTHRRTAEYEHSPAGRASGSRVVSGKVIPPEEAAADQEAARDHRRVHRAATRPTGRAAP